MDAFELIEEEIRKLNELRRMAEDPHMLQIMRKLVERLNEPANGKAPVAKTPLGARLGMMG